MLKSNIFESADRFNRNIMGCKEEIALVIRADAMRFNRNIMGCKDTYLCTALPKSNAI